MKKLTYKKKKITDNHQLQQQQPKNSTAKMKLFALFATSCQAFSPIEDGARRTALTNRMLALYQPNLSVRDLTNYGCNCFTTTDRILSGTDISGPPVDELDNICKIYKQCLKCAQATHGESCLPEFINSDPKGKYKMRIRDGEITCRDEPNSCNRELCECSKLLAKQFDPLVFPNRDISVMKNETFSHWNDKEVPLKYCTTKKGPQIAAPKCCRLPSGPKVQYNSNTQTCCPNQGLVPIGQC